MYANVTPIIVTALSRTQGFDSESAGYVFALNMYGTAIGGMLIIPFVDRLNWRWCAAGLLLLLIALDLVSGYATTPQSLGSIRFLHGLVGGTLVGLSLAVIARTLNPERSVAIFILYQLLVGGTLAFLLAATIDDTGVGIVFTALVLVSIAGLLPLPFLDEYRIPHSASEDAARETAAWRGAPTFYIAAGLIAIFVFQSGEMAAFAYAMEIGSRVHGFSDDFLSVVMGSSLWLGGIGALIVAWLGTRYGRLTPILISTLLMSVAMAATLIGVPAPYILANIAFAVLFSVSFPYLMGVCTELDNTGKVGAAAGFTGSFGLATGPAIAAYLTGGVELPRAIWFGVAAVVLSIFLAVLPARFLDRLNKTRTVEW